MKTKVLLPILKVTASLAFLFGFKSQANAQYCIPTYGTVCISPGVNDFINTFTTTGGLTDISNIGSSCCMLPNNYIYYDAMPLITEPGATIGFYLESGAIYAQGFSIWVDWNNDFVFSAAEKMYSSPFPGSAPSSFTNSFTVPGDQPCGTYRMRVRCEFAQSGATINPCDFNTYGECEDYPLIVDNCEPTICRGDTTTIDFTDSNPADAISYTWSPATEISDAFGGPVVDVWPTDTTTYTVTINTSSGATVVYSFPVNVNVPPNPDAGLDDTLCHSLLSGAPLTGSLENPASTFYWGLGATPVPSPSFIYTPATGLSPVAVVSDPGTYEHILYASDPEGVCPDDSDTVIVIYSEESHTTTFTDPLCFGSADGTITVTSTGILGAVEYSLDGGVTWQTSNVFTGLTSGSYDVISRDAAGCEFTSTVDLTDPAEVVVTASADTTVCQNGTATVSATATGGTTYDFYWDFTTDLGATQTLAPTVSPTTVTVYAVSENGCASTTDDIVISLYDPITLNITANDSVCPGFESAHTVTATGGYLGYTYSWTANGVSIPDAGPTITKNPTSETTYCVTAADGCETTPETICVITAMREVPAPIFTADTTEGCVPSQIEFTNLTPSHLTDEIVWTINGEEITGFNSFNKNFNLPGSYDVQLEITSPYGCYGSITANDYITIHGLPYAQFYVLPNPTTMFNTTVEMSNITEGTDNIYEWTFPGGNPTTSSEFEPVVTYQEGVAASYPISLVVTDENNCQDSTSQVLQVMSDVICYAPNAFTPDGDQLNQTWRVYMDGIDFYDFHLTVYNRWGEIVWESYNVIGEWNGMYGSTEAKEGTYIWVVTAKDATSDKQLEYRGHVTLLK